jgi:hypothetical protein
VSIRNLRWPPPQEKLNVGPCGTSIKNDSYLKPFPFKKKMWLVWSLESSLQNKCFVSILRLRSRVAATTEHCLNIVPYGNMNKNSSGTCPVKFLVTYTISICNLILVMNAAQLNLKQESFNR